MSVKKDFLIKFSFLKSDEFASGFPLSVALFPFHWRAVSRKTEHCPHFRKNLPEKGKGASLRHTGEIMDRTGTQIQMQMAHKLVRVKFSPTKLQVSFESFQA